MNLNNTTRLIILPGLLLGAFLCAALLPAAAQVRPDQVLLARGAFAVLANSVRAQHAGSETSFV